MNKRLLTEKEIEDIAYRITTRGTPTQRGFMRAAAKAQDVKTHKMTLKEAGEWLERRPKDIDYLSLPHKDGTPIADFERPSSYRLIINLASIEALKRGEMP